MPKRMLIAMFKLCSGTNLKLGDSWELNQAGMTPIFQVSPSA